MADNEPEVVFTEPNGNAFVVEEKRNGPPLSFVGSKLYQSLLYLHMSYVSMGTYIPENLPQPAGLRGSHINIKQDGLMEPLKQAFRTGLLSFLSLYNFMGLASEGTLYDRLLKMTPFQFKQWLDRVQIGGSVLG